MATLIERIRCRAADPANATELADVVQPNIAPPATLATIARAEQMLGFRVTPFLAKLYHEVGNGGFGPGYGLIGLVGGVRDDIGQDAVTAYARNIEPDPCDPHWKWPAQLLPVCHLGCAMYLCVDCTNEEGNVIWFEPNPHEDGESWDSSFIRISCNVEELFAAWEQDRDWMVEFAPSEGPT